MDPMTWLMIGQTAGKLLGDANAERQSKEMRAAELRAMPWTGRGPSTSAQFASPWATLGTAATGYMDQMNRLAGAKAEMDYRNKLLDRMAPQAAPAAAPAAAQAPAAVAPVAQAASPSAPLIKPYGSVGPIPGARGGMLDEVMGEPAQSGNNPWMQTFLRGY